MGVDGECYTPAAFSPFPGMSPGTHWRRLGGPHCQSGWFLARTKSLASTGEQTVDHPAHS